MFINNFTVAVLSPKPEMLRHPRCLLNSDLSRCAHTCILYVWEWARAFFLCWITLLFVALHQGKDTVFWEQACSCETDIKASPRPLNWPKCVVCDGGGKMRREHDQGNVWVAKGMFSGRQSARWCYYEEGLDDNKDKVCVSAPRGEEIIKKAQRFPRCVSLLVPGRGSGRRRHRSTPTIACLQPFVNNKALATVHLLRVQIQRFHNCHLTLLSTAHLG